MTAFALAAALSGLPDIDWERQRAEDAHQLMLCQIHRGELQQAEGKDDAYQRAKAVCDLLARDYRNRWDFDAQDALAASAVDLDELIRRGDAVEVPLQSGIVPTSDSATADSATAAGAAGFRTPKGSGPAPVPNAGSHPAE
ncbi:hypothetical protein [Stenotrophomonas sp.]